MTALVQDRARDGYVSADDPRILEERRVLRWGGLAGVTLGIIGAGAAVALLIDPLSPIAVIGVFALILFHVVVGWKVYRLSRPDAV